VSVYPDAPAPVGILGDASCCFSGYHPPRPTCFILVTKRAATVLKVKSKTIYKGKNNLSYAMTVSLNGTWSRIIAFRIVSIFLMQAVIATFFNLPLFTN
jgi:hypothetical protein